MAPTGIKVTVNVVPVNRQNYMYLSSADGTTRGNDLAGLDPPVGGQGAQFNKSDFPTDKLRKQRSLRLTGGVGVPIYAEIRASGVKMETRCHSANF